MVGCRPGWANAYLGADGIAYGDSDEYTDTDTHGDRDEYIDTHGDRDEYIDTDTHGDRDEYIDTDTYCDSDEYIDTDAHGDGDEYFDTDAHGDSDEYIDTEAHDDSDTHAGTIGKGDRVSQRQELDQRVNGCRVRSPGARGHTGGVPLIAEIGFGWPVAKMRRSVLLSALSTHPFDAPGCTGIESRQ